MKNFFSYFGFVILCLITFVYNNKTVQVVKNYDSLMNDIIQLKEKYFKEPVQAIIEKNQIIPGINGTELDIDKTYYQMKKIGFLDETYIKTKKIKPNETIEKNIDKKIISGNKIQNNIAIVILFEDQVFDLNIDNITIFTDINNFDNYKKEKIDGLYSKGDISKLNNLTYYLKKEKKKYFCLYNDDKFLEGCKINKLYTIDSKEIDKNYLINVKNSLENGKIFVFKYSELLNKEIFLIENYVKNKGFTVLPLDKLINE